MKISYYLNESRNKNLYCRISESTERVTFSLNYYVDQKKWNEKKEVLDFEDEHHFTLIDFKHYLTKKYHELKNEGKDNVLTRLKNEALLFSKNDGLDGIAEKLFDHLNKGSNIPKYNEFISAFEKLHRSKKGDYKVETLDTVIHFHVEKKIYEMDTYEGLICRLKSFIENKSYDEIYTETNESIWGEIYTDAGIKKHLFLPKMLTNWKIYWNDEYRDVKESVGKTDHLNELKDRSWREFQVFMECYNDAGDVIELAYELSEDELYPLSVITMMQILDQDACCEEYCELEFNDWESVLIDDKEDSPVFYVRQYEF